METDDQAAAERKALGDEYERAAAHETVTTMNDLETRRALAWLAENHPAQLQAAVQAVRDTFQAVEPPLRLVSAQHGSPGSTWTEWGFDRAVGNTPLFLTEQDARNWATRRGYTVLH